MIFTTRLPDSKYYVYVGLKNDKHVWHDIATKSCLIVSKMKNPFNKEVTIVCHINQGMTRNGVKYPRSLQIKAFEDINPSAKKVIFNRERWRGAFAYNIDPVISFYFFPVEDEFVKQSWLMLSLINADDG